MAKPKQVAAKALGLQKAKKTTTTKKKKATPDEKGVVQQAMPKAKPKATANEAHGVGRTATMPFESAVRMLHRQTNPGLTISQTCVAQINGVLVHLCERLVDAAVDNARLAKVSTLASTHVLCAAELVLPLELAARAVEGAEAARTAYNGGDGAK